MKRFLTWLALLAVIIIGIFILLSIRNTGPKQKTIRYWVAPMNPHYRRDKPGKSPMGMDLVPVYADDQNSDDSVIKISPSVVNNLGVKTTPVKKMDLSRIISTVGYVTADENMIEHIHAYTDGWVKVLNVKTTGEPVKKGQLLLELYSPTLNNAQDEFVLALKSRRKSLINAGEKKLLTLGMAKSEINKLRQTKRAIDRVKIYATEDGIVSKLNIRTGKYIKPTTDLMTIKDLSHIWMIAEVFERQASWVKEGQTAIATLTYLPGKTWQGRLDYVYPELDPTTHTLRVRLTFPNPDLTLKPKMYANIKILSDTKKNALAIPRAALIRFAEGDRVILALGEGRFKTQAVKVGIESGDYFQILSGLNQHDVVVTSAQFLIDSESSLKAGLDRISPPMDEQHEYVGMGKIKRVDLSKRMIVLDHQAIPALNMPAMIMDLDVDKSVALSTLKAGEHIHFVIIKAPHNTYRVTKIQVIRARKSSSQ